MVHDFITPDANSVSWAELWELTQHDIIGAATIKNIIVFDIICYVVYYSADKFTLPIEQPSNMTTKCGIRWSWEMKVKPNLGCCSNIAITIFLPFRVFLIWIIPRLSELRPFKCQGQPVRLWRLPLTFNLEKCYLLRSSLGMYNLERRLRYSHLLTRHCPWNLLPEPTAPRHK